MIYINEGIIKNITKKLKDINDRGMERLRKESEAIYKKEEMRRKENNPWKHLSSQDLNEIKKEYSEYCSVVEALNKEIISIPINNDNIYVYTTTIQSLEQFISDIKEGYSKPNLSISYKVCITRTSDSDEYYDDEYFEDNKKDFTRIIKAMINLFLREYNNLAKSKVIKNEIEKKTGKDIYDEYFVGTLVGEWCEVDIEFCGYNDIYNCPTIGLWFTLVKKNESENNNESTLFENIIFI